MLSGGIERDEWMKWVNLKVLVTSKRGWDYSEFQINPLSANPTKWSYVLKQLVGNLAKNCLSVFDHFVKLALKGLNSLVISSKYLSKNSDIFVTLEVNHCFQKILFLFEMAVMYRL